MERPDFRDRYVLRSYDEALTKLMREAKAGLDSVDEILGQIQTIPVVHGGATRQVSGPTVVDTTMQNFSTESTINSDVIRNTDVGEFVEFLVSMIEVFQAEAKRYMFHVLSQTTEAVGNMVDAQGKNIWDAQIEMIQRADMRFAPDGSHNYKFYLPPGMIENLKRNPPTPEQQKQFDEAISAKREAYYAQKRTRRLSQFS